MWGGGGRSGRLTRRKSETDISKHQQVPRSVLTAIIANVNKVLLTALFRPIRARRAQCSLVDCLMTKRWVSAVHIIAVNAFWVDKTTIFYGCHLSHHQISENITILTPDHHFCYSYPIWPKKHHNADYHHFTDYNHQNNGTGNHSDDSYHQLGRTVSKNWKMSPKWLKHHQ